MNENQIAELLRLQRTFTEDDFEHLESEMRLRAYVCGWTGDPLKQPIDVVLGIAREISAGRTGKTER